MGRLRDPDNSHELQPPFKMAVFPLNQHTVTEHTLRGGTSIGAVAAEMKEGKPL